MFTVRQKKTADAIYYSLEHVEEVFRESEESRRQQGLQPNDHDVWDCKFIESAKKKRDLICNPIYEWDDRDVWQYINENKIPMNPLYEMGYMRVGCIGCPMATYRRRLKEFEDFPHIKKNYLMSFDRMLKKRKADGKPVRWKDAQDVFDWWIEKDKYEIKGQMSLDDFMKRGE